MKTILHVIAVLLLLFNGIGAFYGGWSFISHPDGSGMQMSIDELKHSPFYDYFIPGIILFVANGLGSFLVLTTIISGFRYDAWLVMGEGAVLTGWIVIQVLLLQRIHFLHIILGTVGLGLFLTGWLMRRLAGIRK